MMSSPTLRSYGLAIVISGASLLGFWLLGDLMAADSPNAYVRWVLLVLAAVANGALIRFLLKPRVLDAGRSGSWVAIDDIPGLAWFADAEGRITRVNASLGKYLGIADTEGFNWRHVIHPEDFDESADLMSRCRERGEEFHGILRIRHGDGTYLWFSVVARPRRVSGGRTMFAKESRI